LTQTRPAGSGLSCNLLTARLPHFLCEAGWKKASTTSAKRASIRLRKRIKAKGFSQKEGRAISLPSGSKYPSDYDVKSVNGKNRIIILDYTTYNTIYKIIILVFKSHGQFPPISGLSISPKIYYPRN
jgi:hypothetical protein